MRIASAERTSALTRTRPERSHAAREVDAEAVGRVVNYILDGGCSGLFVLGGIGQGAWLGLFTSYAPVANPRLAVVVITRGTDAHKHLPAAIAGNIYRALSLRFGTQINFQVAEGPDDGDANPNKKAAALDEESKETKAATEAEEIDDANNATPANDSGADLKVKSTTMPVGSKPKPATTNKTNGTNSKEPVDGRSRRTQPQP